MSNVTRRSAISQWKSTRVNTEGNLTDHRCGQLEAHRVGQLRERFEDCDCQLVAFADLIKRESAIAPSSSDSVSMTTQDTPTDIRAMTSIQNESINEPKASVHCESEIS